MTSAATDERHAISHTRNASLAVLVGLCYVLERSDGTATVIELANEAIRLGLIEGMAVVPGERLPTRINHHMIALRQLNLVSSVRCNAHISYSLTSMGVALAHAAVRMYSGAGPLELDGGLRATWRPILVQSDYVRHQWLKYFMSREDFAYPDLLSARGAVTIQRVPPAQRSGQDDSGYRILSDAWDERILNDLERREIYEGLRRWTNEVYLTDDRLPEDIRGAFLYHGGQASQRVVESELYIVTAWLAPDDLDVFESHIRQVLDEREGGDRIPIPELIIALCDDYGYARQNVRDMLGVLYDERSDRYTFERASRFLMQRAFRGKTSDQYYVQLDGIWRTGLVRYEEAS